MRAIYKWKLKLNDDEEIKCPWVAYASRDAEETCWQLKTFNNEHICPRKPKNKAANRKWLASKLVKKATTDARHAVYGDEASQYGLVRDYGEMLIKFKPRINN
ncbi:hypothetical protein PIB30_025628 [Stylosanthes scabra]|uniref:Uncharacterized protein n=1 Tax=Stylosanthes scabra TaxID=79078 RepID=A0ABU6U9J7_9FABA|nr:hypothetical protein [Stylosanthes scabra]